MLNTVSANKPWCCDGMETLSASLVLCVSKKHTQKDSTTGLSSLAPTSSWSTMQLPEIWDTMALMWRRCNELSETSSIEPVDLMGITGTNTLIPRNPTEISFRGLDTIEVPWLPIFKWAALTWLERKDASVVVPEVFTSKISNWLKAYWYEDFF